MLISKGPFILSEETATIYLQQDLHIPEEYRQKKVGNVQKCEFDHELQIRPSTDKSYPIR